jgi:hypothetical protein
MFFFSFQGSQNPNKMNGKIGPISEKIKDGFLVLTSNDHNYNMGKVNFTAKTVMLTGGWFHSKFY